MQYSPELLKRQVQTVSRIALLTTASLLLSACAALGTKPIEREFTDAGNTAGFSKRVVSTTDKIINSFDSFLQKNRIAKGAIAVSYKGKLVASAGRNRKATEPAKVASLSKAITAPFVL